MEEIRVFKWIWRINGIVLLFGMITILILIIYNLVDDLTREDFDKKVIVNVAEDPEEKENWVLGRPELIYASDYVTIPLVSENEEVDAARTAALAYSGGYGYSGISKNILFINRKTSDAHWFFSTNNQLIFSFTEFPGGSDYMKETHKASVIFYDIVDKDTDKDGSLTDEDEHNLAVSSSAGRNYKVLVPNIEKTISRSVVDDSEILLVYQKLGVGYLMRFRISDLEIISNLELPKVENK